MRMLLERSTEHGLSGDEMAYLAGNLYGAGSETVCPLDIDYCNKVTSLNTTPHKTAVTMTNMILAAACYPEAQIRVQEELDMVVGKDRSESRVLKLNHV